MMPRPTRVTTADRAEPRRPLLCCCLPCLVLALGLLETAARAEPQPSTDALGPQLEELQKQLDADSFAVRREASQQLRRLGKKAIPALKESAERGTAESRTRALELLEEHFERGDEQLRTAAQQALEELAQGTSPAARSAQGILHPAQLANPRPFGFNPALQRPVNRPLFRPNFGGIMPGMPGAMPGMPRMMMPGMPNGPNVRITSQQGPRRITITANGQGIDVEITETKDGQPVVEKFHVKDADELKQRHAEAHRILQQVQAPAVVPGVAPPQLNPQHAAQLARQIEQLRRALPQVAPETRPAMQRHIEVLQRMQQQMQRQGGPQP